MKLTPEQAKQNIKDAFDNLSKHVTAAAHIGIEVELTMNSLFTYHKWVTAPHRGHITIREAHMEELF